MPSPAFVATFVVAPSRPTLSDALLKTAAQVAGATGVRWLDPGVAADVFFATEDLARAEIPNQWHLSFGIGHGIDAGGLRQGGLFLAQAFRAAAR